MKYIKTLVILFFLIFSSKSKAQDLITRKDGSKIYCKISKVDSSGIYYLVPGELQQLMIGSVDVESYYILQSLPTSTTTVEKGSSVATPSPIPAISGQKTYTVVHKSLMPSKLPSKKPNGYDPVIINLSGGLAMPIRDFGNNNIDVSTAGLAKLGYLLDGTVFLKFTKYIGISGTFHYQSNQINSVAINNAYTFNNPGVLFTTKSKPWKNYGFFGGLFFNIPIERIQGFSLFADFSFGLPKFISPELYTTGTYRGSTGTITQVGGETSKFAFYESIGFMQKISKGLGINFTVNYFASNPYFSNVAIIGTNGIPSTTTKFSQKIEALSLKMGMSFFLN